MSVAERVALIGAPYILLGKFIPGAANLIAPASGLAGMKTLRFAGLDALALMVWAGAYTFLGVLAAEPAAERMASLLNGQPVEGLHGRNSS